MSARGLRRTLVPWLVLLAPACTTEPGDDGQETSAESGASAGNETTAIDGCEFPTQVLQDGVTPDAPTGFVRCNGGAIRRVDAVQCQSPAPTGVACSGQGGSCDSDANCTAQPYGACLYQQSFFSGCECAYGCATDADCDDDEICACGGTAPGYPPSTMCIPSSCTTDASCDSMQCELGFKPVECAVDEYRAACRSPEDTCASSSECELDGDCYPEPSGGPWSCMPMTIC